MTSPVSLVQDALGTIGLAGWQACALVGFGFAGGLAVWLFGERVFRPVATVLMGFVGTVVGAAAAPLAWGGAATPFQVLLSAVAGLAVGGAIGMIAYRWALALGTGCLLASLSPMVVCLALSAGGPSDEGIEDWPKETASAPVRADSWASATRVTDDGAGAQSIPIDAAMSGAVGQIWSRVAPFVAGVEGSPVARLRGEWGRRSQTQQGLMAAGAVVGLAAGIALGMVRPRWAGVLLTSAVGAALWVPSLAWLSGALNAPWVSVLDRLISLGAPLGAGAVILGIVIQARGMTARTS